MRKPRKGARSLERTTTLMQTTETSRKRPVLDKTDVQILNALQEDCRTPLETIAKKLSIPKSTIHYRMRRLEQAGIIEHYFAKVNATKVGKDYLAVILVRGRYSPHYHERIGRRLANIPDVWGVYYVLGDNDFVVLVRANDREDYMDKLQSISSMPDIERTSTQIVVRVYKEDPRITLA